MKLLALFTALTGLALTTALPAIPVTRTTKEIWQPPVGASWQIVLSGALIDQSSSASIYDIDLFENPASTISSLHAQNKKVICYFSAGTYEDWRPDAKSFSKSDIGSPLDDWEGESWVDLRSKNVRQIMKKRLDMAVEKGCDGVDPDNVDAYGNGHGGFNLQQSDSVDYLNWLSGEAHARGLAIGLKNAGAIIDDVLPNMQWAVNEQCTEWDECGDFMPFVDAGKPVFHIEYPKGDETDDEVMVRGRKKEEACEFDGARRFSTLIKNMKLDHWVQEC
ncbi:endo alpha-1,4 polygalactosaminidase [Aspergillus puulaauensis]|uniref:alpha-galactosidase n=1 Tax=Aspergillus puulaauensis TaxID=1220207 RepID=A0A7R7XUN2_9EURO|nr:uncharacterized protein APUU_60847A [Aspergillus puulaauensis]BCS27799.1 hypothetical protein APUU_60847A [Aspergillus puulaauensis]